MLSSYINSNRLFNFYAHCPKQLQMLLYCVLPRCSGHALWPAVRATVGCLFLSMTRDLPWPLDVMQAVVYRPAEARDFTCGRQFQVYCCLVSYRWHLPCAFSCSCRRIDVMYIPDFGAFAKYINQLVDFLLLRLRNDLYCVEWGVKLYSLTHSVVALPGTCLYFVLKHHFFRHFSVGIPVYNWTELTQISCMW